MAFGDPKPSRDIPALVPGRDPVRADQSQPEVDDTTKKLYYDALPATFKVIGLAQGRLGFESGSGFITNSRSEGLTNAHVVLGSDELFVVTSNGREHQAKIVDLDEIKDLAKIQIQDLSAAENHFIDISAKPLEKNERVWSLGHPLGSDELYISPGKYLGRTTDLEIMLDYARQKGISATAEKILELAAINLPAPMAKDVDDRLKEPIDVTDANIKPGNSGGPFLNKKALAIGLAAQEIAGGGSAMVPGETLKSFANEKTHKFNFEYHQKSDASLWMTNWSEHPSHNVRSGAVDALLGAVGVRTASSGKFKTAGTFFGILAAENIVKNYQEYSATASPLLRAEAGIKVIGDSIALLGSAAMMVPKVRAVAKLVAGVGAVTDIAANFLPAHLILTKTTRVLSPNRPPTPFDDASDNSSGN